MTYPWIGLAGLFIGLVVGQLVRFGGVDSSGGLLFFDLALGWYVAYGVTRIAVTKPKLILSLPIVLFGAFTVWAGGSLLMSLARVDATDIGIAFFYWARLALFAVAYAITPTLLHDEAGAKRFTKELFICGTILILLGYAQLIIFPNFAFMVRFGWDPHDGRLLSTFFDPNFFGMFLTFIITICVARITTMKTGWIEQLTTLSAVVALGLTFSRSAYLALAISLVIIFALRSWRLMLISMLLVFVVVGQVPRIRDRVSGAFSLDATAKLRLESWRESLVISEDHLLTGIGYNTYGSTAVDYNLKKNLVGRSTRSGDSSLLLVLATTGLVGLSLYLFWLASLMWQAVMAYKLKPSTYSTATAVALIGLLPAYVVHSQFVNGLFYPLLAVPFLLWSSTLTFSLYKPDAPR